MSTRWSPTPCTTAWSCWRGGSTVASGDRHSKTEKATPKRKKDARKKGQVARSPEIGAWFSLFVITLLLPAGFGLAERRILSVQASAADVMAHPSVPGALAVLGQGMESALFIVLPLAGLIAVIGLLASLAQVGFVFSAK